MMTTKKLWLSIIGESWFPTRMLSISNAYIWNFRYLCNSNFVPSFHLYYMSSLLNSMIPLQRVPAECFARPYNLVCQFLQVGLTNPHDFHHFSNVFRFLLSPRCGHCHDLAPAWRALARLDKGNFISLQAHLTLKVTTLITIQGAGWDRDHDRSS